ncbi:phosphate signaling complex protein PhoU [Bacillus sp. FJAT-45037]|uniref:phosphate signaling complex protein PhoU n=1 Tax=Bacillus sp. FJAT-45037 TaxID=2011007 RepID=UPI000C23FA65|nr:phosphate signaling complex protein PhoU [Bacillus sp. FJAT-45037]
MRLRENFEAQLDNIQQSILEMGSKVVDALLLSVHGLEENNKEQLHQVITKDYLINQRELAINEEVTLLIARQQPVATDLRRLIVALKISSDLERVGDLAVDIAKVSKRTNFRECSDYVEKLLVISAEATSMLKDALSAYENQDIMAAQKIANRDDKVDAMFGQFIRELFSLSTEEHSIEDITQMAFIARYLERIADYSTNLAEWIVYEVNGKHFDLN